MTILDGNAGGGDQLDADVVVVSVLAGFLATRVRLGQPTSIYIESERGKPAETLQSLEKHDTSIDRLSKVLKAKGYDPAAIGGFSVFFTPHYDSASITTRDFVITGRPGGAGLFDKHKAIEGAESLAFVRDLLGGASHFVERGAYYGVIDDPITDQVRMVSTTRRLIKYDAEGRRWNAKSLFHGLIRGDNSGPQAAAAEDTGGKGSWGSFEKSNLIQNWMGDSRVLGYCHGMNWAIMHCKLVGPWTTPYEVALGTKTSKLASCFGCTTFMYATGYPPSAIHLGRAESWVPLPTNPNDNPDYSNPESARVIDGLNALWASDVAGYLLVGSEIVAGGGEFDAEPKRRAMALNAAVKGRITSSGKLAAANLFLDALTQHKSEIDRLKSLLRT